MEGTLDYRWQKNGMALGGIGAGSVEICQNGELREWDICNMGKWGSPDVRKQKKLYDYDAHVLPFTVRAKLAGKEPVVRRLCHDRDNGEFRSLMYSWYKEIEKIRWNPNFPVCRLQYEDSGLPIKIEAEFASPFVPGQEALAGTPGFYVTFTITNPSDQEAEVSILGKLKNPVNRGTEQRCLRNQLTAEKGCAQIVMKSDSKKSNASNGSLAWSVSADEVSWILGEFAPYFTNYVMHSMFGVTEESYLFDFWDTGKLPNLGIETIPEFGTELTEEEISLMDEQELDAIFEKLLQIACVRHPYERVHHFDEKLLTQPEMKREFILASIRQIKRIFPDENGQENWGDSALCGSCKLAPGERKQIRFVIGWHFPNHFGDSGRFEGHWYAKRFADAGEVVAYLNQERETILPAAEDFSVLLKNTSVPHELADAWSDHLSTLIKCSWWTKRGEFGMWEGYGSCGFHTTDITYQGSFGILALFPNLQKKQMEMGAKFQREDGRVHHFFTPDLSGVDDGYDRVDMNPQFVLLVCRDYLWTGDREYLARMWPHIEKAMDNTQLLDGDGDGLPDHDTRANTYDAWAMQGTPAYIASLWLAALKAAVRMAQDLGVRDRAAAWEALLEKGSKAFVEKLWNGRYFSLWADGDKRDDCCMTDQIDGQWYARLLGLGNFLPQDKIDIATDCILSENFSPESGLVNASYPAQATPTLYTWKNVQMESNWSGIEYSFASFLLENGRYKEAAQIVETVERRHTQNGRRFNHEECGEHYYRALASWAVLQSLTGLKADMPRKKLSFSPALPELTAPWFVPGAYGKLSIAENKIRIECLGGSMKLKQLGIRTGMEKAVVTTMGAAAGNCTGAGSAAMSEKSPNVAADSAASAAENAAVATEKAAAVAAYTQTHADGFLTLEFADGLEFCSGMDVELAGE